MHRCDICNASFKDEFLLNIHQEVYHNSDTTEIYHDEEELSEIDQMLSNYRDLEVGTSNTDSNVSQIIEANENHQEMPRPSVIRYAPAPTVNVTLHAHALPGKVVTHFKIDNTQLTFNDFVNNAKRLVIETLQNELKRLNFIKFGLLLDTLFTNIENEISPRGFMTKNRTIMLSSDIESIVTECFDELLTKLQEHEGRGSGWSLLEIIGLDVRVHKHGYGIRGSSYIPLPQKISNTNSCVNVQNVDTECFKYAMLVKYVKDDEKRPSQKYIDVQHKYNFVGINYPVAIKDLSKFEKQNPTASVNVFGLDSKNNVYPLRITSNERRDHTDLLLITKDDISHYVYIKNFEALVCKQLSKKKIGENNM